MDISKYSNDSLSERRVLFILSDDFYFITHRLRFAKHLVDLGYCVAVACKDSGRGDEIRDLGIEVFDLSIDRTKLGPWKILSEAVNIAAVVKRFQPDLVHVVALRMVCLVGFYRLVWRGKFYRINAVAGMGMLFSGQSLTFKLRAVKFLLVRWLGFCLKGNKTVSVFQNEDDLALAREMKWVAPGGGVLIRGVGIPVPEMVSNPHEGGRPVFLYAGRLLREKGILDLVEASLSLQEQGFDHEIRLVGDFDANPGSLTKADLEVYSDKEWIKIVGYTNSIEKEMLSASVVVLPSYYREGIPKVLLEAGSYARPIITCDVAGCREVVIDGETGFLVPPRNFGDLAKAMKILILDSEKCREMGMANRSRVETEFSESVIFAKFGELYESFFRETDG